MTSAVAPRMDRSIEVKDSPAKYNCDHTYANQENGHADKNTIADDNTTMHAQSPLTTSSMPQSSNFFRLPAELLGSITVLLPH